MAVLKRLLRIEAGVFFTVRPMVITNHTPVAKILVVTRHCWSFVLYRLSNSLKKR